MKTSSLIRHYIHILLLVSPASIAEWYTHNFDVMGTRASIELWSNSQAHASQSFSAVELEMRRIESVMSSYQESSELSAINRLSANQTLTLTPELYQLIQKSLYFSRISNGAFDITYASVGHLYNYRKGTQPNDKKIQSALTLVDWQNVTLNEKTKTISFANNDMKINLGGIAKGYAVDRSIELLIERGVVSAIVSAGGDSRMIGDRGSIDNSANDDVNDEAESESESGADIDTDTDTESENDQRIPWMVGIKHPRKSDDTALRLPLIDTAISTSGDYERYFLQGDKRVHHIINPKTGYSAAGVVSASVVGPRSINCDVLSTTLFVLGVDKGIALINTLDAYDAVMIDVNGKVHFSSGLTPDA